MSNLERAGGGTSNGAEPAALRRGGQSDHRLSMVETIGGLFPLGPLVGPHNGSRPVANNYILEESARITRRTTLWRKTVEGWKIVFHQGRTVCQSAAP